MRHGENPPSSFSLLSWRVCKWTERYRVFVWEFGAKQQQQQKQTSKQTNKQRQQQKTRRGAPILLRPPPNLFYREKLKELAEPESVHTLAFRIFFAHIRL